VRLSRFNLYVDDFPSAGSTLVYNSLTGAFLELDGDTRAELERLDRGECTVDELDIEIDPDWLDPDAQFLVESHDVDERVFAEWYERMRSSTAQMSVVISVTFACNLDCTYCCQADVLDGSTMKHATAEETAGWLAARAIEVGTSVLDLSIMGGEPLLQKPRIETIVRTLLGLLAPHGIRLQFSLITNGVFLTRELVQAWKPLGLVGAQVTLDGDESTHSITRRSKKRGEDSYHTIFRNIIDCSDLIGIVVNGNYQPDTISGFPELISKLRDAGLRSGSRLRFSPAITALGAPPESAVGSCTMGGANPEWMLGLRDKITQSGFNPGEQYSMGPCGFHMRHTYAIDPAGHIYKCPGFIGKPEWAIGHVTSGLTSRYEHFVDSRPHQKSCGSCSHRPDCAGGCVAVEWVAKGREEGVNCEGEYFDRMGNELLKRKYASAIAAVDGSDPFELVPAVEMTALERPGTKPASVGRRSSALRVLAA
jgi:uncharacterized protein